MRYFKTEIRENIVVINFDNIKNSNCFNLEAAKELEIIFTNAQKKCLDGLILTSDYKIFCSGGDLSLYAKIKKREIGIKINREITKILDKLSVVPMPTVVLVQGDCFGGGIEFISAFDKIFSLPNVFYGMWQRKIALTCGWGGARRLNKRVSKKKLQNILLSAELFSAYQALELGLIDAILPAQLLLQEALRWIRLQKELPKSPLKVIKKTDFSNEQKEFENLWMNPEHKENLKIFIESKKLKVRK